MEDSVHIVARQYRGNVSPSQGSVERQELQFLSSPPRDIDVHPVVLSRLLPLKRSLPGVKRFHARKTTVLFLMSWEQAIIFRDNGHCRRPCRVALFSFFRRAHDLRRRLLGICGYKIYFLPVLIVVLLRQRHDHIVLAIQHLIIEVVTFLYVGTAERRRHLGGMGGRSLVGGEGLWDLPCHARTCSWICTIGSVSCDVVRNNIGFVGRASRV